MRNYTFTTRFMSRLFSATAEGDEELTEQVAQDIQDARRQGAVDTPEVRYENNGDGSVSVIDKDNGEVTVAEQAEDGNFDLYAAPTENLERYLHPGMDGVTPGYQQGVPYEDAWSHLQSGYISPNVPGYGLNPEAGYERTVEDLYAPGEGGNEEREFSVATDNDAVLKIFSDQAFCERIFSEVIESEETAHVGDLKVEKIDDDTVVVTSKATGDQAKVTLGDDEMQVDELSTRDGSDEREFSDYRYYSEYDEEDDDDYPNQYESLHVVGVDPVNHIIVDAPEYDEESAQELVSQLEASGVNNVEIFDNPEDARDHAMDLMGELGAETEDDVEEPVQSEFCDHTVFFTRFYSNHTDYMTRLYTESENGVETSQQEIEKAIEDGEQIETDDEIITPVDSETAIVEDKDNGEFTKVTIDGDSLDCEPISEEEADELTEDLKVEGSDDDEDEDEDEEKSFSDYLDYYYDDRYYSDYEDEDYIVNDYGTKMFSEYEYLTDYQMRLFSDEAEIDEDEIEKAIEDGEQIETDDEIITPVDDETAVIEDKKTGEFTKAVLDDDTIDTTPISEEEADELTEDLKVEDSDDDEDEEDEEKSFSDYLDYYYDDRYYSDYEDEDYIVNDYGTKMFSEYEYLTDYQMRLFSDEAEIDEDEIEKAIEDGEQIETDDEIITPVDDETAVIEDKKTGEFTKAVLDDDTIDTTPISEEEADELTEDLEVEDSDEDEDEDEEKSFSDYLDYYYSDYYGNPVMQRFFAEADAQQAEQEQQGEVQQLFDAQGNPVPLGIDAQGNPVPMNQEEQGGPQGPQGGPEMGGGPSVEEIEDKADQAVNIIQQAAQEAANQILQAKQSPIQGQEQDLQEAQFCEVEELGYGSPLIDWLDNGYRY